MELRPLGSSGLRVSPIGLGTVKLGRNTGVKYPGGGGFPLPTDEQAADLLRAARDEGINIIDTAPAYGTSEERLGALMRAHDWFGSRDHWTIVTKAGEEFDPRTGTSTFDFTPEHTRASVERSLHRLACNVLDCVLIHSDGRDEEILTRLGTLQALAHLADRGLIRTYGISTKTPAGAQTALDHLDQARTHSRGVLMATLNPAAADDLPAILSAPRRGVGVLIKKALASGHLPWHRPLAGESSPQLPPLAGEGASPTSTPPNPIETNLRFIFTQANHAISSVIIGTASPHHLRANAAAARRALAYSSH